MEPIKSPYYISEHNFDDIECIILLRIVQKITLQYLIVIL